MPPPTDSRARLVELVRPLRLERERLATEIAATTAQLAAQRTELHDIDAVLQRLDPSAKPGKRRTPQTPLRSDQETRERILALLADQPPELRERWSYKHLYGALRDHGSPCSQANVKRAVESLHEEGVIRLDRVGPGGAKLFVLVGNGASPDE